MPRTTSFTLSSDLDEFVRNQVDAGAFASASEVMREALRRMAEEERREQALLVSLDAGLASGRAKRGVWNRVVTKARRAHAKR